MQVLSIVKQMSEMQGYSNGEVGLVSNRRVRVLSQVFMSKNIC